MIWGLEGEHGETGWGRASYGYYPKVKSRSSQGHIPAKKGENSKFLLFLLQLY